MSLIIRLVLAIIVGLIVAGLLEFFGLLTPHLDALLGVLAGAITFFGEPYYNHPPRV